MTGAPGWRRPAALAVGSLLAAAALTGALGGGPAEWIFSSALLMALATVVARCSTAWREAIEARSTAAALGRRTPDEAARAAVASERRRLMAEIDSGLRALLKDVVVLADAALGAADPRPDARRIHARASEATSELRRQLGLLRDVEDPEEEEGIPPPSSQDIPTRGDLVIAAAATLLAMVETVLWTTLDGARTQPLSVVLTGLAAATVVGRRTWPAHAAAACAAAFLLGMALSTPVRPAIWFLVTVCGLLWTLAARSGVRANVAAGALLIGVVVLDVATLEPDNLPLDGLTMVVAVATGLIARAGATRHRRHREVVDSRTTELDRATRGAIEAERAAVARELHDTVSHAVGLIAVQAAAAEVAWERAPATARASLELVASTAVQALAELDRLPSTGPGHHGPADLVALVERIRSAGTPVRLDLVATPGAPLDEVVYRIAQESLTNVVRHAPGAHAALSVNLSEDVVRVVVSDDGPGVVEGAERGYGLVGLGERVRHAGGTFTSQRSGTGGFCVMAEIPLTREPVR